MSEGELKKRIKSKGFHCWEQETKEAYLTEEQRTGNQITEMNDVSISVKYEDVKKVLDDARKKFPQLHSQIPMSMERVNDYINRELEPWFLKWFGKTAQE